MRGILGRLLGSIALGAMVHVSALAQEKADGTPDTKLPFDLDAKVTVYGGYMSNVFSTDTFIKGDYITVIAPEVGVSKKGETYQLAVGASAEIGRYFNFSSENYVDGALRAEGRIKVLDGLVLFAGGDYLWEHEPSSSADNVTGAAEPTTYTDGTVFGGISGTVDQFTFRLGVNYRHLDFDDVTLRGGGIVNNDDRDRDHLEVGSRVGYVFMPKTQAFVQVVYEDRSYSSAVDDNGFRRSSNG